MAKKNLTDEQLKDRAASVDWDFSGIKNEFLEICYYHEYARESESLRKAYKERGSLLGKENRVTWIGDGILRKLVPVIKGFPRKFGQNKFDKLISNKFENTADREIYIARLCVPPSKPKPSKPKHGFCRGCNRELHYAKDDWHRDELINSCVFKRGDKKEDEKVEIFVARIDWSKPDTELNKEFKDWLKAERRTVEANKNSGKERSTIFCGYLKGLGMWRLSEKAKLTHEEIRRLGNLYRGKTYEDVPSVDRAIKETKARLQSSFAFPSSIQTHSE